MMDLTPLTNDPEVEDLLQMCFCGAEIEAISLDLADPGEARTITFHFEDGRDITLASLTGLLWLEDGIAEA